MKSEYLSLIYLIKYKKEIKKILTLQHKLILYQATYL